MVGKFHLIGGYSGKLLQKHITKILPFYMGGNLGQRGDPHIQEPIERTEYIFHPLFPKWIGVKDFNSLQANIIHNISMG